MLRRLAIAVAICGAGLTGLWIWHRPPPLFAPESEQPAQFLASYTWSLPDDWFGGFSGIEVTQDGSGFVAITDRGRVLTGTFVRSGEAITAVGVTSENKLRNDEGDPVAHPRTDAEGLVVDETGRMVVSFERVHRVWEYAAPDATAEWASYFPGWRALGSNGGLEALAVDADGTLWAIAETAGRGAGAVLMFAKTPGRKWTQTHIVQLEDDFAPVGADFGPDGRLYLLERGFYPFGFRSRVRALTMGENRVEAYETIMQSRIGRHDNLEGLSVWVDGAGRTRLTMISDDNFLRLQKTEIVEYVLP